MRATAPLRHMRRTAHDAHFRLLVVVVSARGARPAYVLEVDNFIFRTGAWRYHGRHYLLQQVHFAKFPEKDSIRQKYLTLFQFSINFSSFCTHYTFAF